MVFITPGFIGDVVLLFIAAISLLYIFLRRHYSYWERKGFKTLPGSVYILGHLKPTIFGKEPIGDVTRNLYNATNEPFIGMYTLLRPVLLVRDPELIRTILIRDFAHFSDRGQYCNEKDDPLSSHLVSLPVQKWKPLRAKLTPTFTSGKLKGMFSTLVDCGATLQNYLTKFADKKEMLDIREISASHTTNVIASVGFGIDVDTITNPGNDFRTYGKKIFKADFMNSLRRLMVIGAPKLMKWFRIKTVNPEVEKFILSIVQQNLEFRENNNVSRKDFFQLLIQLRNTGTVQLDDEWDSVIKASEDQKTFTLNEIAAQSFIFFAAGFETSSTTLSFCLYELAKNAEIQQNVHDEIDRVLGQFDGKLTYESVSEMKYLEHCIDGKLL